MDIMHPTAVIGTNAWGSKAYSKAMRGSYVSDDILIEAIGESKKQDIQVFDMARDYGLGKAQKMLGQFGTQDIIISAKYPLQCRHHLIPGRLCISSQNLLYRA